MALQTSGAISLGDIHVEAEGSPYAGTGESSLNDANIRGLTAASGYTINSTSGTQISIGDFYGASASSTTTVTVTQALYVGSTVRYYGKFVSGSTSPTSVNGFTILYVFRHWKINENTDQSDFWLYLSGTPAADDISSITLNFSGGSTEVLDVADAFTAQSGTAYRYWAWNHDDFSSTTKHLAFVSNWDGSGNVTMDVEY